MKITRKQIRRMVLEILDAGHPADVDPVEDVWSGDIEGQNRNLELYIDHPTTAGGEPTTREPKMLPGQENMVTEAKLRSMVRDVVLKEEAADCESDYRAGGLTWDEYQDCLKRFRDDSDDYDDLSKTWWHSPWRRQKRRPNRRYYRSTR